MSDTDTQDEVTETEENMKGRPFQPEEWAQYGIDPAAWMDPKVRADTIRLLCREGSALRQEVMDLSKKLNDDQAKNKKDPRTDIRKQLVLARSGDSEIIGDEWTDQVLSLVFHLLNEDPLNAPRMEQWLESALDDVRYVSHYVIENFTDQYYAEHPEDRPDPGNTLAREERIEKRSLLTRYIATINTFWPFLDSVTQEKLKDSIPNLQGVREDVATGVPRKRYQNPITNFKQKYYVNDELVPGNNLTRAIIVHLLPACGYVRYEVEEVMRELARVNPNWMKEGKTEVTFNGKFTGESFTVKFTVEAVKS